MKSTERASGHPLEVFTDRITARKAFWGKYNEVAFQLERNAEGSERASASSNSIIMFYGIGGIGKSTLIAKLESELARFIESPLSITYDFADKLSPLPIDILDDMRKMLTNKYKFQFPTYDFAILAHAKKQGRDTDKKAIKNLIDRNPFLSAALSLLRVAPIPGASFLSTVLQLTDKGYVAAKTGYQIWVEKRNVEIQNIIALSPNRIEQNLPLYFARDLSDNLDNISQNNKAPLVVFIDTYENLVNEMNDVGSPLSRDEWLRGRNGLIRNTDKVLWVITGRNKIRWDEFDIYWKDLSPCLHSLKELSRMDSSEFLSAKGIENEEVREAIWEATEGVPIYLESCVELYKTMQNLGEEISADIFRNSDMPEVIARFIRYMQNDEIYLVYFLSCFNSFNDELFWKIANGLNVKVNQLTYDAVKKLSFVLSNGLGEYAIHQVVRKILYKQCPDKLISETEALLAKYGGDALSNFDTSDYRIENGFLSMVALKLKAVKTEEELWYFFRQLEDKHIQKMRDTNQYSTISVAYEMLLRIAAENAWSFAENPEIIAEYLSNLNSSGDHTAAVKYGERMLAICADIYGENDVHVMKLKNQISECCMNIGEFIKADSLSKSVVSGCEETGLTLRTEYIIALINIMNCNYERYGGLDFNIQAKAYDTLRKLELSNYEHYELLAGISSVSAKFRVKWEVSPARSRKILRTYKKIQIIMEESFKKKQLEKYADFLLTQSGLMLKCGRNKKALRFAVRALDLRYRIDMNDYAQNSKTIDALISTALCYRIIGKATDSATLAEKALNASMLAFDQNQPRHIANMVKIANIFTSVGEYEKASEVLERIIENFSSSAAEGDHAEAGITYDQLYYNDVSADTFIMICASIHLEVYYYTKKISEYGQLRNEIEKEVLGFIKLIRFKDKECFMTELAAHYFLLGRDDEAYTLLKQAIQSDIHVDDSKEEGDTRIKVDSRLIKEKSAFFSIAFLMDCLDFRTIDCNIECERVAAIGHAFSRKCAEFLMREKANDSVVHVVYDWWLFKQTFDTYDHALRASLSRQKDRKKRSALRKQQRFLAKIYFENNQYLAWFKTVAFYVVGSLWRK